MTNDNHQISGWKTVADWKKIRPKLVGNSDPQLWTEVYNDFFFDRLEKRYFRPIKILQEEGTYCGEGYSILAIQCTLIEFLESTIQGMNYRFVQRGQTLGPYEYGSSKEKFIEFLSKRPPFMNEFNRTSATQFYVDIRCGILHEARTINSWKVHAESSSGAIMNYKELTIYRNGLQDALLSYLKWYENELVSKIKVQEAFIRKYDSLCT